MGSILKSIEDKMAELIDSMVANPYNYVWGATNQRDMAKATYPNACIYLENEENLDEESGTWGQAYFNAVTYRIEVRVRLDAEYDNPPVEVRGLLYNALDDLKRLFGNKWSIDGTADTIMYRGCEIVEEPSSDVFIPSKMITRWLVKYEQDRLNPTQVAQ